MDDLKSFVCACLGIPEGMCKLYDKIENDFRSWEYYNLEESFLKQVIKNTINEKGYKAGNILILDLFTQIIDHYVDAYCDYPLTEDLFKPIIDGDYSELQFNGKKVSSAKELDKSIEKWILTIQKQ